MNYLPILFCILISSLDNLPPTIKDYCKIFVGCTVFKNTHIVNYLTK